MKNNWARYLSIFMILVLLITSVPFSLAEAKKDDTDKKSQRAEIAKSFNEDESEIQSLLDKGHTASEISVAYMNQATEEITLEQALGKATKVTLNRSKDESVVDKLATKPKVEKEKSTVANKDSNVTAAAAVENPVDKETLNNLDLETNNAPYSIGSTGESISTLDGSLSLSSADITLPGRNGLSFNLTRSYNSSDSQYYDIKSTIYDDDDLIYSVFFKGRERTYRLLFAPKFQMLHKREYAKTDGTDSEIQVIGTDEWTLDSSIKKSDADKLASKLQNAKPSYTSPWSESVNGYKKRDIYTYVDNSVQSVDVSMEYTGESTTGEFLRHQYIQESEAKAELNLLNSLAGSTEYLFDDAEITGTDETEYLIKLYDIDSKSGEVQPARIDVEPNTEGKWVSSQTTIKTYEDTWFPLGKGWSWNIPYIKDGTYVHLASGGTYERDGSSLKGYPWDDISIADQSGTISVNQQQQTYKYILSSIDGSKQYFNADGHLIKMTDSYGNYIDFAYAPSADYGRALLSKISDPLGNEINITYSKSKVVVTSGTKTITYSKISIQNNGNEIEILDRVTDPENRVTRYEYTQATDTRYNMLDDNVSTGISNGYALINTVYHPTGAETKYEYKSLPTTRYVGPDAVNQAYQIYSREDRIVTLNPDTQKPTYTASNRVNFDYPKDIGSSYGSDLTFSTVTDDGLAKTTYQYDKDYIDASTPTTYYLANIKQEQSGLETSVNYTYDRAKQLTTPSETSTSYKDIQTGKTRTESTKTEYDAYGNITSQTDEQGVTIVYTYHPRTNLVHTILQPVDEGRKIYTEVTKTSHSDPDVVTQKENSQNGKLLGMSDYDYDSYGNVTKVKTKLDAEDLTKESVQAFEYDPKYKNAFITSQQTSGIDSAGKPFTLKIGAEYDLATGNMLKYIDGKNLVTSYEFDKLDRLLKITNPDQTIVSTDYDDDKNTITQTSETGAVTEIQFDPLGRETQQGIYKNGSYVAKQKIEYDNYSRIDYQEDAVGNVTNYDYQSLSNGLKTIITYPDNSKYTTIENVIDLKSTEVDGLGNKIETTMDQMGQPVSTVETAMNSNDPAQSKVTQIEKLSYDYIGNVKTIEDAKKQVTKYDYDFLGNVKSVTDAKLNKTSYEYDLTGNLTKIIYPDGSFTEKLYDEAGRLKVSQQQGGKQETYLYDGNSNLKEHHTRTGVVLKYDYDTLNRLEFRQDGSETIQFTYTLDGLRNSMSDSSGITSYAYDEDTRELQSITYPDQKKLVYQYDERGNVKNQTGPFNDSVTFDYDTMSRIEKVNGGQDGAYTYNANGSVKTKTRGNGITAAYSFEGLKLSSLEYEHPSLSAANYRYQYDDNSNITTQTKDSITHSFTYDELDRIKTSSLFQEVYDYDTRGNRQTLQSEQVPEDTNSNYVYDNWDRLTEVTTTDQTKVTYQYNGDDLMIERTENGITSRYYYDQYGNIIAEGSVQTDGSVKKVASYVRNGNQLNYRVDEQGEKQYYVLNGHGDVEYIVDSDGEILNSYTYDLWGKPISKNEKVSNIFLYAGEYWDPSTNLQYLRARWYNPNIGRFINEDTYEGQINSPQTLNLYAYVQNNPLIYTDPTGHASQGHVVGTLLDVAKQDGTNSERYWRIRSNLGTQALNFFPDAKEDGNNKFKYLFNMATLSGYSSGQASWAKEQLMFAFETKYQYDQAAFEQYLNGLLISLHVSIPKVPKVASAAASVTRVARNSQVGVLGELKLAELVGGKPNQYFKTTLGGRYVDQLSNGIAYESKMGFVNYSSKVMTQISKDAELLSNGSIDGATWVFFRSPSTGKIGADQRVLDALASYGIKYIFK
ncbi:RHS repeat-associated core domain-containing protein [Paenibacillus urinalis]|uniref:RHS repeat domain-containing protein n=1 Tax=Paenibacillus TaxID=44249 RepID=UPI0004D3FE13|nr:MULTISPECIES: RHS repeat-associated core domain-containing protein [Paenibacillus]WDH96522.1 RHS repeat-associated core domain-containing protein [Paenibacillus urinalis]GAK40663.1 hypothetical protein TCA2_3153 [Paenibacillus sp. TCA20]